MRPAPVSGCDNLGKARVSCASYLTPFDLVSPHMSIEMVDQRTVNPLEGIEHEGLPQLKNIPVEAIVMRQYDQSDLGAATATSSSRVPVS
jgi:hypothetical protein